MASCFRNIDINRHYFALVVSYLFLLMRVGMRPHVVYIKVAVFNFVSYCK